MKPTHYLLLTMLSASQTAMSQNTAVKDTLAGVRIGYADIKLSSLSGAIGQVTQERMSKGLIMSSLDALSGQAAGVQVQSGGSPEVMVNAVRVRGTTSLTGGNDPLVIIDGVASDLATLSTIYPADIQSFTILKDASETAQYGSRGASGVIEVATKKGRDGQFHISYDGNVGFESVYKRLDMLSAEEYREANRKLNKPFIDKGYDTNFRRCIERTGFVQNHHVAFGGGSSTANYRASVGVMQHRTVIHSYNLNNYIAKLDVTQKAFDERVTVDLGVFGSIQKNNILPFKQKLFYSAATFNPTFPNTANADGTYEQVTEAKWINNPNSMLQMQQDEDNAHINAHLRIRADLGYGITLTAFGSYSYNTGLGSHYYPTYVWNHGEAYRSQDKKEEVLGHISIKKSFTLPHSTLNLLALAESQNSKLSGFHTTVSNFTTDGYGYDNLSAGAVRPWSGTGSFYTESHMKSFMLRAQYTLLNKYTLTLNARTDASSKFGPNHRWGFFPSISGAWVILNRPSSSPDFVNKAKVRVGFGLSGNLGGIDSYNSMQLVQPIGLVPVDGAPAATLGIIRNANPDLKWEVKRTFNIGADLMLWKGRISLSADVYRSKTTDMLYVYDVPVPPNPYKQLLANMGAMSNSGVEIGFGISILRTKDVDLNFNTNWSFERNKLESLDGYHNGEYLTAPKSKGIASLWGPGFHGSSDVVMQIVGEQLGVFYLPHCKGLIAADDGSYSYDVTSDKYICGQATPKAVMGSNISLRYRQWDITLQLNGAFGHKIYNGTALTMMNMLSLPNYNVMADAPAKNIQSQTISDYWLENGDFVNVDYVTLGWNIPIRSRHVSSLRLSCSVNNLFTVTGYSGLTPLINSTVVNSTLGLDDNLSLPVYRSYSMAVSVKF